MATLKELEEKYNLELDKVLKEIETKKPKTILLQFPDGLKPISSEIANFIEEKTKIKPTIWLGSCFGACDTPKIEADLLIQFGHSPWGKKEFNEL
jgi:2-(3-amino-3-carboxypropyl)histidine synthase